MRIFNIRFLTLLAVIALVLSSGAQVSAIEPVALPKFTVLSVSNAPVAGDQISGGKKWILVYLVTDCKHCGDILHDLEIFNAPVFSKRVAILVGGAAPKDIQALTGPHDKITSLGWYADTDWQAYKALSVPGMPVVFGIRDGIIEWSIAGTPWGGSTMNAALRDWINY